MAFEVPPLGYGYDALAPTIDEQTMRLHHDKHHQAYVDKLNGAVADTPALQGKSLEEFLAGVSALPPVVRNNGGGHWNHSFFWEIMTPGGASEPTGELKSAIDSAFGSLDAMKEKFNTAGANQFGSGWAWLVAAPGGALTICSTPNQDNPLMDSRAGEGDPHPRQRRLGARLLPHLQQPPPGLPEGLVDRGELGTRPARTSPRRREAARGGRVQAPPRAA